MKRYVVCWLLVTVLTAAFLLLPSGVHAYTDRQRMAAATRTLPQTAYVETNGPVETLQLMLKNEDSMASVVVPNRYSETAYRQHAVDILSQIFGDGKNGQAMTKQVTASQRCEATTVSVVAALPDGNIASMSIISLQLDTVSVIYDTKYHIALALRLPVGRGYHDEADDWEKTIFEALDIYYRPYTDTWMDNVTIENTAPVSAESDETAYLLVDPFGIGV